MLTMEITRLIERCRQGDADALGELYKAYANVFQPNIASIRVLLKNGFNLPFSRYKRM